MRKPKSGFSVLELVIALAIILIVAAIAVPSIRQATDSYRLGASGRDVAYVLRLAQMKAVQTNQIYAVQYGAFCGDASKVCASPAGAAYNPLADPTAITAGNVALNPAGLPATNPPNIGGPLVVGPVIFFNARGMPCVPPGGLAVGAPNTFVCQGPAAFQWFLQSSASTAWGAVTVTPAGRIRSWRQTNQGTWN